MIKKGRKGKKASKSLKYLVVSLTSAGIISLLFLIGVFASVGDCANSNTCIKDLSGKFESSAQYGTFNGQKVAAPVFSKRNILAPVLGDTSPDKDKHIYVDLTNQRLYAFEDNTLIYNFPVSTGKYFVTPTGDFNIWIKLRYTRMSGGVPGTGSYYNLPNVPYTMFFYNESIPKSRGYGIHGAYWHNNFGHPMSHGCVNMKEEDVALIYEWADPTSTGYNSQTKSKDEGTHITIYGTTPKS